MTIIVSDTLGTFERFFTNTIQQKIVSGSSGSVLMSEGGGSVGVCRFMNLQGNDDQRPASCPDKNTRIAVGLASHSRVH